MNQSYNSSKYNRSNYTNKTGVSKNLLKESEVQRLQCEVDNYTRKLE